MKALLVLLVACDAGTPKTSPPGPAPKPAFDPANAFVLTFDPDVVGTLTPQPFPEHVEWLVDLAATSSEFPTPELHITSSLQGTATLTIAPDHHVTLCLTKTGEHGAAGQRQYERDPAKRQPYRGTKDQAHLAYYGMVAVAGGVATITLDHVAEQCDAAKSRPIVTTDVRLVEEPQHEITSVLTCIATTATSKIPVDAIACHANDELLLHGLGQWLAKAKQPDRMDGRGPSGHEIVFGNGLTLTVNADHNNATTYAFAVRR
ncbi:MAG: hypothetical protein QM831_04850 [Kofleriaceae bacterium]